VRNDLPNFKGGFFFMETIEAAYQILIWVCVIFLAVMLCACLVRAILGPRFTDRIVGINLVCAKGMIMITLLSYMYSDSSLLDIAVVYAMISFLMVVVLSKCYTELHTNNPFNLLKADDSVSQNKENTV
jgi:multicomponent Na+:H+ antiporter subunit F